jgi:hypothetical protein
LWEEVDAELRGALQARMEMNRRRTFVLLSEFGRVNAALQRTEVRYALIKGFSLTDEFCRELWLRHQSDIDLLVDPADATAAIDALGSLEYELEPDEGSGEICLAIRSGHVPSAADCIYHWPQNWHLEIHTKFYMPHCGASFDVGAKWAEHLECREIGGVRYPSLDVAHRFVMQAMHVFRHTSSWARMAWLYEIAYFAGRFGEERALWSRIDGLLDEKARNACGIACALVASAFGTKFPAIVEEKWMKGLPPRQASWIARHGEAWMLSDFPHGNKAGLLLQREFADSPTAWWRYRAGRYRKALRRSEMNGPRFLMNRARRQIEYVWQSLRWMGE